MIIADFLEKFPKFLEKIRFQNNSFANEIEM